jgi:2,5-diamino-6-(ribosylamino)-4(3H)-pyrimidinone 5'-phosphate reductase
MVEGGARVIQSFLSEHLVDALVVTTAPLLIGSDGVGYSEGFEQVPGLKYIGTELLGRDTVIGLKLTSCPPARNALTGYLQSPVI